MTYHNNWSTQTFHIEGEQEHKQRNESCSFMETDHYNYTFLHLARVQFKNESCKMMTDNKTTNSPRSEKQRQSLAAAGI